jgi:hypothetical protein
MGAWISSLTVGELMLTMPCRIFGAISKAFVGVSGQDGGSQSALDPVGHGDGVFGGVYGLDDDRGPEGLLVGRGRLVGDVGEDGGLVDEAVVGKPASSAISATMRPAEIGANAEGLMTTVHPAASDSRRPARRGCWLRSKG